jgi:hypothetical protein
LTAADRAGRGVVESLVCGGSNGNEDVVFEAARISSNAVAEIEAAI